MSLLELNNGILVAGTDTEIFVSENFGQNWIRNYQENIDFRSIANVPHSSVLYFGTSFGCYKSNDFGKTIEEFSEGLPKNGSNRSVCINSLVFYPPDYLFAATEQGIFISDSFNPHWRIFSLEGTICYTIKIINTDLLFGASNGLYLYAGEKTGVIKLLDSINPIKSIVNSTDGKIVVLIGDNVIKYTENFGHNWNLLHRGLEDKRISMLSIDNRNRLYAVTGERNKPGDIYHIDI